jgi:nucleotide-binding universal stress UspA family protein
MSEAPMNPILVPVDGSDCSRRALDVAVDFAGTLGAEIVVCHVADLSRAATMSGGEPQLVGGALEELQVEGAQILADAVKQIAGRVPASTRAGEGTPVEEIDRIASQIVPSFIVVGSHGRSGLRRLVMGSVAEGVVRAAPVPVMVVPCAHQLAPEGASPKASPS